MPAQPTTPFREIARYTLVAGPLAVLIFLAWSSFFSSYQGQIIGQRAVEDDRPMTAVLVQAPTGPAFELPLANEHLRDLDLPVIARGYNSQANSQTTPTIGKTRFQLHALLTLGDGTVQAIPTTSPYALAAAVFAFAIGFFLRNMLLAGSPLRILPQSHPVALTQAPAGQPAPTKQRSTYGPPPTGRRSKRKR